jgi:hypothetical protein
MREFDTVRLRGPVVLAAAFAVASLLTSVDTAADEGIISGFFRGSEMKTAGIGATCPDNPDAAFVYRAINGVTSSVSGDYDFSNTGHHYSFQTQIALYTSFDPEDPTANRVGWTVTDTTFDEGAIALEANTEYVMVVQSFDCGEQAEERGEWSFMYRGAGTLSGPSIYSQPSYGSGAISSSSLTFMSPACGLARYEQSGPINVPVTGEYRYSDSSVHFDLDIEVYVYEGDFNPNSPETNLSTLVDDGATIRLKQGVDYYLVTAPWGCGTTTFGDYQFALLGPSGEFVITEGVSGAWANFNTLGQGQFMEVYPDRNLLFAAWFTWDTTQPDAGETADVGDPNHRWLTAQGGYEGDTATLDITLTRGGLFDDPTETLPNETVGSMTIQFLSCSEALLAYDLGERSRSFTINKLANDNDATCDMLRNQHKVPVQ